MDNSMVIVLVITVFALVVIAAFVIYRHRAKVRIKGPLGTGLEIEASNQPASPTPGVGGGTGPPAVLQQVTAGRDFTLRIGAVHSPDSSLSRLVGQRTPAARKP